MKILNMGSLNIDLTYSVSHIVRPGETIESTGLQKLVGGKGLNQSVSLGRVSKEVYHMGFIGEDGDFLKEFLEKNNVNTDLISLSSERSGNAIIQVDSRGENSIILYHGANFEFTKEKIDPVLEDFKGQALVLQNEINHMDYILKKAKEMGLFVFLNPSPITESLLKTDLSSVDFFILNETEAKDITGAKDLTDIDKKLLQLFPDAKFVMTKGKKGSVYFDSERSFEQKAHKVEALDTTGAGDTFTGYFISKYLEDRDVEKALAYGTAASALSVQNFGAAASIPHLSEVEDFRRKAL
ncbi:MAG: ribokinase [Gallicola sp.]|nr:ribokinase [Gallicola sp.]